MGGGTYTRLGSIRIPSLPSTTGIACPSRPACGGKTDAAGSGSKLRASAIRQVFATATGVRIKTEEMNER
jgi:hypothetical protein